MRRACREMRSTSLIPLEPKILISTYMRIRRGLSDFKIFLNFLTFFLPAELEILETVGEIEVQKLRGAQIHRNCQRNRGEEASRSFRSLAAELEIFEIVGEIEVPRFRGAPVLRN